MLFVANVNSNKSVELSWGRKRHQMKTKKSFAFTSHINRDDT